ncbi:SDR family oxidoreductase [Vibrio sp. ZSDZ34]|uniref:SDR family oxidoreductase n=1 Tax=Vibrio gelatinilyticus TaxID=2893468 RepID=A0A9X1WDK9_9VIBR|nr:DUF2867 domain-containing protein [Vibrio gelatinilyticus]MCJ2377450.1 SDR family oxidoreductase [Vibrio gelatinilyticus]
MSLKRVLVLGASGYVGSQLIPQLLKQGYLVTGAARQIDYLKARVSPHPNLTLVFLDLADEQSTLELIPNYDIVFFLVHGMAHGHDFLEYEIALAHHVKKALDISPVEHVIYLSAIQPQTGNSEHLAARKETGNILRTSKVPITELRAGVVIGPGSAAFEIMRDFSYNLPILITPKWVDSKANPIALENLNHYLIQLSHAKAAGNIIYEVGGPDTLSYRAQFEVLCREINKPLRLWATPLLTPKLASYWLGVITSVPSNIGRALLSGLEHDFVANASAIHERFPQTLIPYQEAVANSLKSEGKFVRSNVWGFEPEALTRWQAGYGYYPKKAGATYTTNKTTEQLWQVVKLIGSREQGYFFANTLWRTREWLDLFFGGGKPIRRSPPGPELNVGDFIDSWKVIRCEKPGFLSLLFGMKGPGLGRLEFTITDKGDYREINITAWWHPEGFRGLLYWFAMMPAHLFIFRGMVRAICRKA